MPGARSLVAAAGLTGIAVAAGLPELAPIWSPSRAVLGLCDRLPDTTAVALTFDDGPHSEGTPLALDLLSEFDVTATFFLVGEQVEKLPRVAAEIARRGHRIGLHGYRHRTLVRLTARGLEDELSRAAYTIASATGTEPVLYRPPRGMFTYTGLAVARGRGLTPVLWAADGRDWRRSATPTSICARVTARLSGGEIILLHDADHYAASGSWRNTLGSVPLILAELTARGLRAVPLPLPAAPRGCSGRPGHLSAPRTGEL